MSSTHEAGPQDLDGQDHNGGIPSRVDQFRMLGISPMRSVDHAFALANVVGNMAALVPVLVGVVAGVALTTNMPVYTAMATASVLAMVLSAVIAWRQDRVSLSTGLIVFVVGLADLLIQPLILPVDAFNTLAVSGTTVSVASAISTGLWTRTLKGAALVGVALMVAHTFPAYTLFEGAGRANFFGFGLIYPAFSISTGAFCMAVRRFGEQQERLQNLAIDTIRRAEHDRYRLLVHDTSGILSLLGDEDTPELMTPALRGQATKQANRLRRFLSDEGATQLTPHAAPTLATIARDATDGFEDLPLELALDLGEETPLDRECALAVQGAITTLLHNVRRHAQARQVVIHADCDGSKWELTIRDDGIGMNLDATDLGFGLSEQVFRVLGEHNMKASISSRPGGGTVVTITGERTGAPPRNTELGLSS